MGYDPEVLLRALAAGGNPQKMGSQMVPEDLLGMRHRHPEGIFNPEATLDPSRVHDIPAPPGFTYWPPEPGWNIGKPGDEVQSVLGTIPPTFQWQDYAPQSAPFDPNHPKEPKDWPPVPGFFFRQEGDPYDTMQQDSYTAQSYPFDYLGAVMRLLKKQWGKQDDNGEVDWI